MTAFAIFLLFLSIALAVAIGSSGSCGENVTLLFSRGRGMR